MRNKNTLNFNKNKNQISQYNNRLNHLISNKLNKYLKKEKYKKMKWMKIFEILIFKLYVNRNFLNNFF